MWGGYGPGSDDDTDERCGIGAGHGCEGRAGECGCCSVFVRWRYGRIAEGGAGQRPQVNRSIQIVIIQNVITMHMRKQYLERRWPVWNDILSAVYRNR